ncbi:MAG: 30S ribosomal protein S4 [Planctomycetes bacterium]|nr:30S ribosomal protein S4 [Planctomycetota bacterium]MBI3846645.1 30S ribosomal protein S4 [Planctomycetota bacterium]
MGRHTDSVCKLCRREGVKLFLKGTRCHTPKCAVSKREYPPGMHPWRRGKPSAYGIQLREKQKLKRAYGIWERQFRRFFDVASHTKGNTGEALLLTAERRLDNVLTLIGFAMSRPQARQLIVHGHISVNGRRTTVPSLPVRDKMVIKPIGETATKHVRENIEQVKALSYRLPEWLTLKEDPPEAVVERLPRREEVSFEIQEQLIVELLSK